jgi:hypothetical protein
LMLITPLLIRHWYYWYWHWHYAITPLLITPLDIIDTPLRHW